MCPPFCFCSYEKYLWLVVITYTAHSLFPPKFWCLCNVAFFELLLLVLVMRQNFLCKHAFDLISPLLKQICFFSSFVNAFLQNKF